MKGLQRNPTQYDTDGRGREGTEQLLTKYYTTQTVTYMHT
jgi:hypothetical protein